MTEEQHEKFRVLVAKVPEPPHGALASAHDDDGGKVGAFLARWFGRSYRTTLAGLVATVSSVVAIAPGVPPGVQHMAQVIASLASGAGLVIAKDSRVSGVPK